MPRAVNLRTKSTRIGSIVANNGNSVPENYLVCDGSILNIEDYPALYSEIGFQFGYGNNDGLTFNLPDLRGRFDCCIDNGAGRDGDAGSRIESNLGGNIGDAVGSLQEDSIRNISGYLQYRGTVNSSSGAFYHNTSGTRPTGGESGTQRTNFNLEAQATTGSDNRPANVTAQMIIKAI